MLASISLAFLIYFVDFFNFGIFEYSQDLIFRIFLFFLLCSLIAIAIILLTSPISNKKQVSSKLNDKPFVEKNYKTLENKNHQNNKSFIPEDFSPEESFSEEINIEPDDQFYFLEDENDNENQEKIKSLNNFKNVLKKLSDKESFKD